MIDLFVKCWASSHIRLGMAMSVVARNLLFEARVHVILAKSSLMVHDWKEQCASVNVLPDENFHIGSKALAEELAESETYVVIDCDHLAIGKTWIEDGVRVLANHPEYACLSSWSINGEVPERLEYDKVEVDWQGHGKRLTDISKFDEWCWESECTGTPYFLRKGIIEAKRMPVGPLMSYDSTLSEFIRKKGKIGFLRKTRHNHLGFGFSQVISGWWKA